MTTRRTLLAGLAAMPPAPVVSSAALDVSPRLAALKSQYDAARAFQQAIQSADEDNWDAAWEAEQEIARAIMAEPVATRAEFELKLAVWEQSVQEDGELDDDMTGFYGWHDRALPHLFNDASALLGCPGMVA